MSPTQRPSGLPASSGTVARFGPLIAASTLIGIGMGGFVDGIVLHQVLQVHNMLSARIPPTTLANMEVNMVWDGLFHAFTWLTVFAGIVMLFKAGQKPDVPWSGRTLAGGLLQGWAIFNIVEGIIDHHILHLHHVIERLGPSPADYAFLAFSVVLLGVGRGLIRAGQHDTPDTHPSPGTIRQTETHVA
jgi:uncharacterized membrane protein